MLFILLFFRYCFIRFIIVIFICLFSIYLIIVLNQFFVRSEDGTYNIEYNDGNKEYRVPASRTRFIESLSSPSISENKRKHVQKDDENDNGSNTNVGDNRKENFENVDKKVVDKIVEKKIIKDSKNDDGNENIVKKKEVETREVKEEEDIEEQDNIGGAEATSPSKLVKPDTSVSKSKAVLKDEDEVAEFLEVVPAKIYAG